MKVIERPQVSDIGMLGLPSKGLYLNLCVMCGGVLDNIQMSIACFLSQDWFTLNGSFHAGGIFINASI